METQVQPNQAPDQETPVQVPKLPVMHSEPTKQEEGKTLIAARRKNVAESLRFRAVWIDPPKFSAVFDPESAAAAFSAAVTEAVESAASDILRSYCEQDEKATEVPASMFTLESIINRMSEQQAAVRLNGDQIAAWYKDSQTAKDAAERYGNDEDGKRKQNALAEKYKSLASNNPAIVPSLATKMLAYLSTADSEHPVCKAVSKRLDRIQQVNVSADEL